MTLSIKNVTKQFGEKVALDNLSLEIPEEKIYGFLGGNGAGKTTTFRMLLGLMDVTMGEITWNDEFIGYDKSNLVGNLPEERGLYPKLKVQEQIVYLGKLRGMKKKEILAELKWWLNKLKIEDYIDKRVEELSKGNQQKIQFISSVVHRPKLLILDEPFTGLDPINVEILKQSVVELKERGTSIVFSSHRMDHVEELCEELCILSRGKQVLQGSLMDIKKSYRKKNLIINVDFSTDFLSNYPGVTQYKSLVNGCELQIENADVSQSIFSELQGKGFIRKFDFEEPSLNDIFIEKVGSSYE